MNAVIWMNIKNADIRFGTYQQTTNERYWHFLLQFQKIYYMTFNQRGKIWGSVLYNKSLEICSVLM